jgi:TonB family protein
MDPIRTHHLTRLVSIGLALLLCGFTALGAERLPQSVVMSSATTKQLPVKPSMALQLKLSGEVQLDVTIDEAGSVERVDTLRGNPILAKAAQDAVRKWKFKPFQQDEKVVKVVSTLTFDFK